MLERGGMAERQPVFEGDLPVAERADSFDALEQRVQQLEGKVAGLQDTSQLEDRIVARVSQRVSNYPVAIPCEPSSPLLGNTRSRFQTAIGVFAPSERNGAAREGLWILGEMFSECRAMLDMFLDPRYRHFLPWMVRFVPLLVLGFFLTSQWIMPWSLIPLVGPVLDKALGLGIGIFAYKILGREARRYREIVQR